MAAWIPPSFRYHRQPDGTITIFDEEGNEVPTPPTMKYIPANGDSKVLDPWGNEVPEFTVTYPKQFFIHTAADGSMMAVDSSGVPLPIQPEMGHGGSEMLAESDYAVLPDGTVYDAPEYEFPDGFLIHTFPDGSMMAVDSSGVPLSIQPEMGHELDAPDYAVLSDGTKYVPSAYEFPDGFFIHTFPDGSMMAVDSSGVPLPIQPTMGHGGSEMLAESDYAVLPDGTVYEAPPLYPPAGETPEVWPPVPWPPEFVKAPEDEDAEPEEVVGADSADDQASAADGADDAQQADSNAPTTDESTAVPQEETGEDGSVLDPDPAKSYSGVRLSEGDVLLDDDFSADETEGEGRADVASPDLLTVGLVDSMPDDGVVSATPIPLPIEAMPVGGEVVSATPIPLPIEAMPVGGEVVSATPIPLPIEAMPVGGEEVSTLPVPSPGPPAVSDVAGDEIALDRKGDDRPVDINIPGATDESAAEFQVEVIDEVQVEEVRLEDVETGNIELAEPIVERGDALIEEEDVGDLDG